MNKRSAPSPQSSEEILKLHDEAFVRGAYRAILGRAPDPDGLGHYLAQVRAGVRKTQILAELVHSPESVARSNADNLASSKHLTRPVMLVARMLRRLTDSSTARHMRVVDNRLYLLEQAIDKQAGQLAELLSLLHEGQLKSVYRQPGVQESDISEDHAALPSQLPSSVARTYAELKSRIAKKQSE